MIFIEAEVKTLGNVKSTLTAGDTLLVMCMEAAQKILENYCGFTFDYSASFTDYIDAVKDEKEIALSKKNISGTTTLYYDKSHAWGASTAVDAEGFYVDTAEGRIILNVAREECRLAFKVTATGGWTSANAPYGLKMACIMLTAFLYDKCKAGAVGIMNDTQGAGDYARYQGMIPEDVKQMANQYKRWL